MSKLFLVRHAEPAMTGVLLGHANPPLSREGRAAARAVRLGARIVYTSPLRRAIETAAQIGLRTVVLEELTEIGYGSWDGKTWDEIEQSDPTVARLKEQDWIGVTPPGGEDWQSFTARVERALEHIRRGPFPAAVVAHAAVNAQLASLLNGRDPFSFRQDYCEVVEVEL